MQAQDAIVASSKAAYSQVTLLEKWNFAACGPTCIRLAHNALPETVCGPACEPTAYRGTVHALRSIIQKEGARALWKGTDLALMMSIPMVGIYLPLYDYLLERIKLSAHSNQSPMAPLLAGALARTVAVYCTAPFEFIRTRMQAPHNFGHSSRISLSSIPSLWTGVGATMARDVPFSGLYWALVEPIRHSLLPNGATTEIEVASTNIIAGGLAGAIAGAVTTPLDVVKTRTQLALGNKHHSILHTLRLILSNEGVGGVFQGWSARAAKAAPACAIVLSAYEILKFYPPAVRNQ